MKENKKAEFEKFLKIPKAGEAQQKVAMEQIKIVAFREMAEFDFENNERLDLSELSKKVAKRCGISDIALVSDIIELALNTKESMLKVDVENIYKQESGSYQMYQIKSIIRQPSKSSDMQMKWQKEKNAEAKAILQNFVNKVKMIMETLPKKDRYNAEAIKAGFDIDTLEKNPIWIDLAIEKAIKLEKTEEIQK